MKKSYSKPDIVFESFSLSTNIAAGCEWKTNLPTKGTCAVQWGRSWVFTESIAACTSPVKDGSKDWDGLCYHNPSESYNVFNS